MNTSDSSLCHTPGGHPPPVFTRLATKCRSLPKGKLATHPVEFLRQHNSVSKTTYILTISHGHSRHLLRLLSQKTLCLQIPKSTAQLARHTCFHQANKKKFSTPPPQSRTQPSRAQRVELPPQQRQVIHTIRYLYPLPIPHPHLTPKYTHLRPTTPTIPFYGSIFCSLELAHNEGPTWPPATSSTVIRDSIISVRV